MNPAPAGLPAEEPGSFRDRDGQVYLAAGEVLRGLSANALSNFLALRETAFFRRFADAGDIVATETIDPPDPQPPDTAWAGWLSHERVPFVSYPYEWTYVARRRTAAVCWRLRLPRGGPDATPYNVQFLGAKPVFIDLPSFEPAGDSPWAGYRQFCRMYLYPLMLQAYKGLDFQPFLRAGIDGVGVQQMARLCGMRDRLRAGVFSHVWLQALLERRYGGADRDLRGELGSAGFNRELVLANVRRLAKLVRRLDWKAGGSEWADYVDCHNYTPADHEAKRAFVEAAVQRSGARSVWDLGCNTGTFSDIAARRAGLVLAMDADHLAVERLFRNENLMRDGRILPLVQNLADPSPAWGWNLAERKPLLARGRPELVLCLALLHHLVIGANVPLQRLVDWLASLGGDLVVEFVGRGDDKVATLLRNRVDQYGDYHRAGFEACLARHYRVLESQPLAEGRRVLYHCRPKDIAA